MSIKTQLNKIFIAAFIIILVMPAFVSANTSAGIKPTSIFYFLDTAAEKISLFFTFDSEKKARKALEYANERLAEAEESASENKPKGVEKAMEDYAKKISLATEKSKEVKDEKKTKELLNVVSENTAKHQEILEGVLEKVPDEAKEAILKAIEVSKRGQEKALQEITVLKKEIVELKDEIKELKEELENKDKKPKINNNDEQIEQLKKEVEQLKQEVKQPELKETKVEDKKDEPKIVTLPNGAIVEMDKSGNIIKIIKEAPQRSSINTTSKTTQRQPTQTKTDELKITSVKITPYITIAKIEWETNKPTESKIFLSGNGLSSKIFNSESGLSTRHIAEFGSLIPGKTYSYEIEAISNDTDVIKKSGEFTTLPSSFSLEIQVSPYGFGDIWVFTATGEDFVIEAMTISTQDARTKDRLLYEPNTLYENGLFVRGAPSFQFKECRSNGYAAGGYEYPYYCPQTEDPIWTVAISSNWNNNNLKALSIKKDGVFHFSMPNGGSAKLEFLKAVGKLSGKEVILP
jgi:hypothetical protein